MFNLAPTAIQEERLAICKQCEFYKEKMARCSKCGCFMAAKVMIEQAKCPIGEW